MNEQIYYETQIIRYLRRKDMHKLGLKNLKRNSTQIIWMRCRWWWRGSMFNSWLSLELHGEHIQYLLEVIEWRGEWRQNTSKITCLEWT